MQIYLILSILCIIAVFIMFIPLAKKGRRDRIKKSDFPSEWKKLLENNVKFYNRLSPMDQQKLREKILIFVDEKKFTGLQGFEITDQVKLFVAAQACLLTLKKTSGYYDGVKDICITAKPVRRNIENYNGSGIHTEAAAEVLGVSTGFGTVVLAWSSVVSGLKIEDDGVNVVFHEFAHELDREDGDAGGVPVLDEGAYKKWADILSKEYNSLTERIKRSGKPVINPYGAENPAEFFAVSTETFFEKPEKLRKKHPELFDELKLFYGIDPRDWN